MTQFLKPSGLNIQWASAGDILDPGDTKYMTGWGVEIPPRQWENYVQNKQDNFNSHVNQHGICVWDEITEYQYEVFGEKSIVMGSDGIIYRTLTTNTNQDPTTTVGVHWEIAFADAGAFYTKIESDGLYLTKAQNLADLTNTATARTNLSVYSQAQTYTKTEVDSKTTIASAAQAQALISNTTLLTPLRLAEAFKGANQSLSPSGYQKLPGGWIVQWGSTGTVLGSGAGDFTFPIQFPSNCAFIVDGYSISGGSPAGGVRFADFYNRSTTGASIRNGAVETSTFFYLAVGY